MADRSTSTRAWLLAGLLAAFAVLLVLVVTSWGPLHRLDVRVADDLNRTAFAHDGPTDFWTWVSRLLHPDVERVGCAIAAIVLWIKQRREMALFVVIVLAGEAVLESVVKLAVGRHRPVLAHPVAVAAGNSFPSGHALAAVVTFGVLVLLVPHRYKAAAAAVGVLAVLLVSYSRLALGVHYVSDILGAWLLGLAWLVAAGWGWQRRRDTHRAAGPMIGPAARRRAVQQLSRNQP